MTMTKLRELLENGHYPAAKNVAEKALQFDPDNALLNYYAAWSCDGLSLENAAIPYYEKALVLGLPPEDLADAYIGLGSTYRAVGNYEKAGETFQKAQTDFPENKAIAVFASMALYNAKNYKNAMSLSRSSAKHLMIQRSSLIKKQFSTTRAIWMPHGINFKKERVSMSKELEIEFKNMLIEDEYQLLIHEFRLEDKDFFTQTNYYFDTSEFKLKEKLAALRIRKRAVNYELTLKTPEQIGLLETTQILAEDQVTAILDGANIPVGQVRDTLKALGIDHESLLLFGSLTTTRAEIPYKNGLLVFDKSFYSDTHDFELEYEVPDFEKGQILFDLFLSDHNIPKRPTKNKIIRLYEAVYTEK